MRILVIGAGQGGMQAAKVLAQNGNEVTVFESSPRDSLGHDQIDTVETPLFDDLGIKLPEKAHKSHMATFVAPDGESTLLLSIPEENRDWNIERRYFAKEQVEVCEKSGVEFRFGTPVQSLIFEKDVVKGIRVNDEDIYGDLVIDSSGVFSKFRKSFGGKFGITDVPDEDDIFCVFHGYYEPAEGVELPEQYKFYLKYAGYKGISWCGIENSGDGNQVSVLVGKTGTLSREEIDTAFNKLKEENPVIGEKVIRGGDTAFIPLRYPAPIMVAPGYASVGDCAFMTIPLLGNGIANAIRAGQMLAYAIVENGNTSIETLWKYNVEYYKSVGAVCCFVDFLKRALMSADEKEVSDIIRKNIISDEMLAALFVGSVPKIPVKEIAEKVAGLVKARKVMGMIAANALKGVEAMIYAGAIPKEYNPAMIYKWQYKMESFYK